MDLLGVLIGLAIAVILAPYIGSYMRWNQATIGQVQWCSLIILFTSVATPRGLLQLCDRFDLFAFQITVPTVISMLAAFVAAILNAILGVYLPLLLTLTPSFGVVGTGIATLSSTALILILNSVLIWHQLRQKLQT
ncbi:MAG: hypothetical protein RM347_021010 [Nostoc sp. ChiQUE02]|nr:hypothetical protein [Nostoc sp. ChiQUE02]